MQGAPHQPHPGSSCESHVSTQTQSRAQRVRCDPRGLEDIREKLGSPSDQEAPGPVRGGQLCLAKPGSREISWSVGSAVQKGDSREGVAAVLNSKTGAKAPSR